MRLEIIDDGSIARPVGAAFVRPDTTGVVVELGPADGPPLARLRLTKDEATQLGNALKAVVNGRSEAIILVED
jgi:hypothetical protein